MQEFFDSRDYFIYVAALLCTFSDSLLDLKENATEIAFSK